ncbi:DUF4199 domain-containing protein [Pontibacter ruber]|uniref:DUF4199 domain-containing protein n=1 Tax=Pontibacter ruber TaxID=1343895 RepID=A0ABW5D064_9BACT|nr:DUF4199 domain-containing protein [Pontibacter ruber]
MFNQAIIRVGVRYGVICGLACFVIVVVLHLLGYNPFGDLGRASFLPIPIFIFLGLRYYKRFNETELGFLRGLRVGLSISFYTALCTAMLVFLLIYLVGPEMVQRHVAEMKLLLEESREEQIRIMGEQLYEQGYKALDTITPSMLAADDFVRRILAGAVFSLVAAVFFRK